MIIEFCKKLNLSEREVLEGNKNSILEIRQMYWLMLYNNDFSYSQIARLSGLKSHATILSGIKHIRGIIETDKKTAELWEKVKDIKRSSSMPLYKEHMCFKPGHNFYLVAEIDNGRSKIGYHKCSRCGYEEHFQYDYN